MIAVFLSPENAGVDVLDLNAAKVAQLRALVARGHYKSITLDNGVELFQSSREPCADEDGDVFVVGFREVNEAFFGKVIALIPDDSGIDVDWIESRTVFGNFNVETHAVIWIQAKDANAARTGLKMHVHEFGNGNFLACDPSRGGNIDVMAPPSVALH